MTGPSDGVPVGRLLTGAERAARMADEAARDVPGEVRRSAFAISPRHLLTAWHCVREAVRGGELWFRLRMTTPGQRQYIYLPVRVTNFDEAYDVAALAVDEFRLAEAGLSAESSQSILAKAAIPLEADAEAGDQVLVAGFPVSATGADSDTNIASVVDGALPLGPVTGLKLYCAALAAVEPVDPRGLSGGPVLLALPRQAGSLRAVAVIRAAPAASVPSAAAGGGLVATRVQDVAERIPEIMVALARQPATVPGPAPAVSRETAFSLSRMCWRRLAETAVEFDDPVAGRLVGWSHFFDESREKARPTAFGTAYGLKTVMAIGQHDGTLSRSALAETLWRLQLPEGGWMARTSMGSIHPELTALVLGALASSGFSGERMAGAVTAFEGMLSAEADPVGMTRTWVVSSAIRGLVLAHPLSPRLPELRTRLLAGAIQDADAGDLTCWPGSWLDSNRQQPPSTVHTAMAVIALIRSGHVLGDSTLTRTVISQAVEWLTRQARLTNQTEQIRRPVTLTHADSLTVRHFTAAWVARALLAAPGPLPAPAERLLADAVSEVCQAQHDGLWEWEGQERPVWMTYQGLSVIRHYALRSWAYR